MDENTPEINPKRVNVWVSLKAYEEINKIITSGPKKGSRFEITQAEVVDGWLAAARQLEILKKSSSLDAARDKIHGVPSLPLVLGQQDEVAADPGSTSQANADPFREMEQISRDTGDVEQFTGEATAPRKKLGKRKR